MSEATKQYKWNICGHENVVKFLQSAIENRSLSHAYLFHGQSGLGKYKTAKEFGKAILCSNQETSPCQNCHSCNQIEKGSHFDFFELSRAVDSKKDKLKKDISVEQVRELISKLQQGSLLGGYKIAIINGAQYLNVNSANALLKTLEEPAPNTVIILIADDLSRIPKTVISRCQKIKFLPVATKTVEKYLVGIGAATDEAKILSRICSGIAGKAISFHYDKDGQQKYFENINQFLKILSSPLNQRLSLITETLSKDDTEAEAQMLLDDFTVAARDLFLMANDNEILASNLEAIGQEQGVASNLGPYRIEKIIRNIKLAKINIGRNISAKNALENLAINL